MSAPTNEPGTERPDTPCEGRVTASRYRLRPTTRWLLGGVVAALLFQVFHAAEHVAQATHWLLNPAAPAWMSAWAMAGVDLLAGAAGGPQAGMELLHLIGNGIFLAGLLAAARLPERIRTPEVARWLRAATVLQSVHVAEHVLLTVSVLVLGQAVGVSTLFGLLTAGTPVAAGYRVLFHLVLNLVGTALALKAALAVRAGAARSARRRVDRVVGYAVLATPLVGLLLLLPGLGGHH